jgi:hypothetical protein
MVWEENRNGKYTVARKYVLLQNYDTLQLELWFILFHHTTPHHTTSPRYVQYCTALRCTSSCRFHNVTLLSSIVPLLGLLPTSRQIIPHHTSWHGIALYCAVSRDRLPIPHHTILLHPIPPHNTPLTKLMNMNSGERKSVTKSKSSSRSKSKSRSRGNSRSRSTLRDQEHGITWQCYTEISQRHVRSARTATPSCLLIISLYRVSGTPNEYLRHTF